MAADIGDPACSEWKVRRTRVNDHAKLLVGERVEVRSVEEGFQGSWHSGTVIACQDHARRVQYDHLLCDDGSENLIECVEIPPIIDGVRHGNKMQSNYRGLIRPLPPRLHFGKWCLRYGQCVDVCYRDAWWEGVIFDHEDNSEHHNIFFPDIGDTMTFGIEMLRITQDWDEFTEGWKPRGNWIFLELIEEFRHEWPLQVSVRQIWYDIRGKKDFENLKEWTSSMRNIWKNLVLQVIYDNLKLTLKEFFLRLDSSGDLIEQYNQALDLCEPAPEDVSLNPQTDVGNSLAVIPCQNPDSGTGLLPTNPDNANVLPFEWDIEWDDLLPFMKGGKMDLNLFKSSKVPCLEETAYLKSPGLSTLLINPDEFSGMSSISNSKELFIATSKMPRRLELTSSTQRKGDRRLPADHDLVPEAEFCPEIIGDYYLFSNSNNKPSTALTINVRKYLVYQGWKIGFTREQNSQRLRYTYTSPAGKTYHSLCKLCQDLCEPAQEIFSLISQDGMGISSAAPDMPSSSPLTEPRVSEEAPIVSSPSDVVIEPEYCPQAVVDICSLVLDDENDRRRWWGDAAIKELKFKAKKHLSAVGWSLWHIRRRTQRELRYCSPRGKCYSSLQKACKACINEGGISDCDAPICSPRPYINATEDARGHVVGESSALIGVECMGSLVPQNASREKLSIESSGISPSRDLVAFGKIKVQGIRKVQKKRKRGELTCPSHLLGKNAQNAMSSMSKKGRKSRSLIKLRSDPNSNCQIRVLRSSKRARHVAVPHSSHHNPRTVLSWLIDNNVVLPRAKVYYSGRKDHRPMAEGRITRDGIKCSCCQNVFTLHKFEVHAGSSLGRPSSNIFLEDGRSLLQCQLQLKRDTCMRSFTTKHRDMKSKRHHSTNDYICSVCHFGGELILCDQCPSSFHASCLGLKDVPDGDWFCPSCCCGICGQSRISKDTEQFTDDSVLNCGQCEHQYHVGCLRKGGLVKLKNYPKGNWFCNKRCEQIFLGLRRLMGRPVPVGTDNLTWTLLRYMKCESDYNASDIEALMENYSKLNVALSVMHECFEPVKESRTRRDLVEDIIFSRWSELNRLNFRGFYTVLLERNDELITVATVRVYGEKVAEIPLVGTRFQYRRLGMCRILMNELEKKLMELGVERLVLPAVPSLLHTWTTSFGFSKMTESERLNFLDYTFLDFQGTIMCQKLLNKIAFTGASLLRGTQQRFREYINGSDNNDFDVNSAVSEVFQADQIEDNEIVHQGQAE